MTTSTNLTGNYAFRLLSDCGGYYNCPTDGDGKRLGPLVGYGGRDKQGQQFVGDVYVNFTRAERKSEVLKRIANDLFRKIPSAVFSGLAGFCGTPEGGKALAAALSLISGHDYIFPEKEVTAVRTANSREKSKLVWGRHEPVKGEKWIIVEDVCNNFSTTENLVNLIRADGAEVVAIVCFLNRSLAVEDAYTMPNGTQIPVVCLVRQTIMEWEQDDPEVSDDIKAGNVVLKPKLEWSRLMETMARAAAPA